MRSCESQKWFAIETRPPSENTMHVAFCRGSGGAAGTCNCNANSALMKGRPVMDQGPASLIGARAPAGRLEIGKARNEAHQPARRYFAAKSLPQRRHVIYTG